MGFEWVTSGCIRRIYRKLIEQNVPVELTLDEACENCKTPECERKHAEPLELTMAERRMLDSGASIVQIEKARKDKLEREWLRRKRELGE